MSLLILVISQREKKVRGEAYENIVIQQLESLGCLVAERHRGYEQQESLPDLYAYCDGKLKRIEVKETTSIHLEGEGTRAGRFVLSEKVVPKECYAFGIDDYEQEVVTTDFVKKNDPDEYVRTHGKRPKYPISRLLEVRDGQRCFPKVGTIEIPRQQMLEEVDKVARSWR